jgi:hypothetical protein
MSRSEARPPKISPRYLLYIDILGFAQLASANRSKVEQIYRILDSLNVHRHDAFKTIVFSDTVLVYNPEPVATQSDAEYIIWYLIEFAEDLHHRFTGQELFFRAVLVSGEFDHYKLDHIECFFGQALINAHLFEKSLPGIGLFISDECDALNKYFRTARFDENLLFVYLNRGLEQLNEFTGGIYPAAYPEVADIAPHVPWHVEFLKTVYKGMREHPDPSVRSKYLTTWDYHDRRYPELLQALVGAEFSLAGIAYDGAWANEVIAMRADIEYFQPSPNALGKSH